MKNAFLIIVFLFVGQLALYCQTQQKQTYQLLILKGSTDDLRKEAASLKEKYPNMRTFVEWESPYAKLFAGECGTKEEADKLQKILLKEYPDAVVKPCTLD